MIIAYITAKDKKEAEKISTILLDKRLLACANYFQVNSRYLWKGKIVKDNEYAIICKTLKKNIRKIKENVAKIHSYECPCIVFWKAKANAKYKKWVKESIA